MSTAIMAMCWPLKMPATAKAVLISLADNANDHGECWPSQPKIAERTCLTDRTVRNAIKWLEDAGYLVADRSNGRHTRYTVTPTPERDSTPETASAPERDSGGPRKEIPEPRKEIPEPRKEIPPNRKEPSRTVNRTFSARKRAGEQLDFSEWPELPSDQLLADWLLVRKKAKAVNTKTALDSIGRQLQRAVEMGISVDDCIRHAVNRNWRGFELDWLLSDRKRGDQPQPFRRREL